MIKSGLLHVFIRHKVAANLLMALMLLAGISSLFKMNIQFLPTFDINVITVSVSWPGASAEDVEKSLIYPLEKELRSLEELKKIQGKAKQGRATITLEFEEGSDLSKALEKTREHIGRIGDLPKNSKKPIITQAEPYEVIARLLIYGPTDLDELRNLSYQFERELLDLGIGKITIVGLPKREILIQVPPQSLVNYKLSLPDISQRITKQSQDIPAGKVGSSNLSQNIKIQQKKTKLLDFESLPLFTDSKKQLVTLSDIATIRYQDKEYEARLLHNGKPAVELKLLRAKSDNTLKAAEVVNKWFTKTKTKLGDSLKLVLFEQKWRLVKQRIDTLIYNGLSGLVLVILILFIVLNREIAFWVALGIPTAVLASLWLLSLWGGSINMVSLFAFILTFGIVVDDAIVIGEQTSSNLADHDSTEMAILSACHKMLPAILSSSLTTISAFFPLLFISGIMGTVLFDIPLVVICVILASLIECFFVLPGHLYHSFSKKQYHTSQHLSRFNHYFNHFRNNAFTSLVQVCIKNRFLLLALTLSIGLATVATITGGYLKFTFFPSPDAQLVIAQAQFIPGTPEKKRLQFLEHLRQTANQTSQKLENKYHLNKLITTQFAMLNRVDINSYLSNRGENYASYTVELISGDERSFNNLYFIRQWKKNTPLPTFVESLSITSPRGGPPGKDIDIQLSGNSTNQLKQALIILTENLKKYPGVSAIKDNLPYAQEQWVFSLNSYGRSLQLTSEEVGRQIRAAFNGETVQTFYTKNEEIDVKVILSEQARNNISTLYSLPIITPGNTTVPLDAIVDFNHTQSPDVIIHTDTKLTANITAEVDSTISNSNEILNQLSHQLFQKLKQDYHVDINLRGKSEEQAETLNDIKIGVGIALILIYIILAWVFNSYSLPFLVMIAIPLGLIGAIIGHLIMGLNLTILSLFGLFGLSGIVINDSIILINEYKLLRQQGFSISRAIEQATKLRLRAVLLTTLTTIAGLTPLLFETSLQAQFLIPMATSITFGLAFATLLILIIIPAMLYILESTKLTIQRKFR